MGSRAGSIEKSTGVSWEDWTAYLLDRDATKLSHQAIVALVTRRVGELEITTHQATGAPFNTGWWCQGIAIQFEEDHGLRASGQKVSGDFGISVSRTLPGTIDEAIERWIAAVDSHVTFNGVDTTGEPRRSSTEKWRYWRVDFEDGTAVSVQTTAKKGPDGAPLKAVLSLEHAKLPTAASGEQWRTYWKSIMSEV